MTANNSYLESSFGRSSFCQVTVTNAINEGIAAGMHKLATSCLAGNIAARIITPLATVGAYVVTSALQVAGIVEPIFGIIADLAVALVTFNTEPLKHIVTRLIFIPYNTFRCLTTICLQGPLRMLIYKTMVGILDPEEGWTEPAIQLDT
jgi:hypothetical protein